MAKSRPQKTAAKPKKGAAPKSSKGASKGKTKSGSGSSKPGAGKSSGHAEKPVAQAAKAVVRATKLAVKAVKLAVKNVKADVNKAVKTDMAKQGKADKFNGRKINHEPASSAKAGKGEAKDTILGAPPERQRITDDSQLPPFLRKQKERLIQLRDNMLDSMSGVAKDTLRARAEGSEASAFGMHQADAGSDAYDRDFALSLLSQEQDALYEIEEALKRIELGTYGTCEMSGKPIARARLEAIPFARYTVECQSQLEKQNRVSRSRVPVTSLFGLTDGEESAEGEEEEPAAESKE